MKHLYGYFSKEQMDKYKTKLHKDVFWLLLYKDPEKNEQTYSERQIYDQAMHLFVPEYALVNNLKDEEATVQLSNILKSRVSAE